MICIVNHAFSFYIQEEKDGVRLKKNSRGIQSIKDITKRTSYGGHLKLNM